MSMKRLITALGSIAYLFRQRRLRQTPQSILVIKIGALGDVLMTTPFIRALRMAFPKARIVYAVGKWSRPILEDSPRLDRIVAFDEQVVWKRKWRQLLALIGTLRLEKPDLTFVLDKHMGASLFASCAGGFRVGFDRRGEGFANNLSVPYGPVRHEILYYLDLLRAVAPDSDSADTSMEVFYTKEELAGAEAVYEEYAASETCDVAFMVGGAQNPNQTAFLKRWPLRLYSELAGMLIERNPNVRIWLFGGPADVALNQGIVERYPDHAVDVAGIGTVKQSMALMRRCAVMVTHDTGPMHMAAAAGVPVVSLSGPVHPGRTVPHGKRDINIWKPNVEGALSYDDEGKFPSGIDELPCMTAITPQEVAEKLRFYGLR